MNNTYKIVTKKNPSFQDEPTNLIGMFPFVTEVSSDNGFFYSRYTMDPQDGIKEMEKFLLDNGQEV